VQGSAKLDGQLFDTTVENVGANSNWSKSFLLIISVLLLGHILYFSSLLSYKDMLSITFWEQWLFKKYSKSQSVWDWSLLKEEFNRSKSGKKFDCPGIKLPDYVKYVVAIGGLPGGGGRTIVNALEEVLNINFGEVGRDIFGDSKDNKHLIYYEKPRGLLDLVVRCRSCTVSTGEKICELLSILGPIGTSPDNIAERKRPAVCSVMKRIHQAFERVNFQGMDKIWIFKYAESVLLVPLLARIYGDRFRFIFNVRHPSCQTRRNYNTNFKLAYSCYHPIKNDIYDTLAAIDIRIRTVKKRAPKWFLSTDPLKRNHIEVQIRKSSNKTEALKNLQPIKILTPNRSIEIYEFYKPLLVDEDILFVMTWREIAVPIFIFLKEEMAGRFEVVRHEDLLTADGLRIFVDKIKGLLNLVNLVSVGGDELEAVADNFAAHSASCPGRMLPNWTNKYIEGPLSLFNYNKNY